MTRFRRLLPLMITASLLGAWYSGGSSSPTGAVQVVATGDSSSVSVPHTVGVDGEGLPTPAGTADDSGYAGAPAD
jgi:hypothetical protein